MKNIILGILITSASVSFAQTEGASTHQLKNRFSAKKAMVVQSTSVSVSDNSQSVDNTQLDVSSPKEANVGLDFGVVSIEDGIAYIYVKSDPTEGKLLPSNLPERMKIDGQKIQFNYTCTALNVQLRKNLKRVMEIEVFDVSVPTGR